jgi:hypothetical protein
MYRPHKCRTVEEYEERGHFDLTSSSGIDSGVFSNNVTFAESRSKAAQPIMTALSTQYFFGG